MIRAKATISFPEDLSQRPIVVLDGTWTAREAMVCGNLVIRAYRLLRKAQITQARPEPVTQEEVSDGSEQA